MPGKDGTGPVGDGPARGRGRRIGPDGLVAASTGYCLCPNCGEKVKHVPGLPCTSVTCPKCQTMMIRE
ncbi:DUF5320 domain-containing protein [Acetobacterium bakii]|uniref:Ferredoxin n=1 Tax=Acetobacterium bakii TaxID=52689 RepID=A0A0L6TYF8_9FIRM|nr:DUF5320 domain-containing protein [Acetobacterium bakii]KNZ41304.1 hypothetical protein AKG39_13440 [Acetobacterium bakii]